VLTRGWAYGTDGTKLHGKTCLWVTTTGAPRPGYSEQGLHTRPFEDFSPAIEQTARFCGMSWAEPLVLFGAHRVELETVREQATEYRARLTTLAARARAER